MIGHVDVLRPQGAAEVGPPAPGRTAHAADRRDSCWPGGAYGSRRITRALGRMGVEVARCTIERLMAKLGLEGVIRGRRYRTTVPEPSAPRPPDLVDRDFTASRPDQLRVADMTMSATRSGWAWCM
ncbi:IS3 family transposase [Streptomyces sp. ITFR-16]|uniref:IS3 family transposase n=1 Tax=Streptomyces sp. ITFR-16 TaxID=3075198 RepID=UPI002889460F|nr:IS3 family transposase [Streptomyces sp. ITFR-16]WNI20420.1 IS3 family transposase [Streptomyces sp. ITFR-16]